MQEQNQNEKESIASKSIELPLALLSFLISVILSVVPHTCNVLWISCMFEIN